VKDLAVLSHLTADLIVPTRALPLVPGGHTVADGIFIEPGGAGSSLVAARRLGLSADVFGAVGPDRYAAELRAIFAAEGVGVEHVITTPERATILCVTVTDEAGQFVYLDISGKGPRPQCPPEWAGMLGGYRALLTFGTVLRKLFDPSSVVALVKAVHDAGVAVFFDPGFRIAETDPAIQQAALWATSVLLLTQDEAERLLGISDPPAQAQMLRGMGPEVVVIKQGAAGSLVVTPEETFEQPAYPVTLVDTVGAGDAFAAGLIAGYVRGGSWRESAALASAMGAAAVTVRGAGRRIPPIECVLALLGDHPAARLAQV